MQASNSAAGGARRVQLAVRGREHHLDGAGQLRSCARQARRNRSPWLKSSACMRAISCAPSRSSSSTARSHARSSARASCGETSPGARALAARRPRAAGARPCSAPAADRVRGAGRRRRRPPSVRIARAIAACAHFAALPCAPRAVASPARTCARNSRRVGGAGRFGPRAPDVDARVVVAAGDADAVAGRHVHLGRPVELAARGRRCGPPRPPNSSASRRRWRAVSGAATV